MGAEHENKDPLKTLQARGRELRSSLASILASTDALRRADANHLDPADRLPYLDAIWRDGSRVLDIINGVLASAASSAVPHSGSIRVSIDIPNRAKGSATDVSNLETAAVPIVRPETIAPPASPCGDGGAPPREARGGTAYFGWLRSRLTQIEALGREGARKELTELACQLRESAASMGFAEISEAASAVMRLAETPSAPLDAGVEILRRVINRTVRKTSGAAA